MSHSTTRATVEKWREWKARNSDWPLTVAPNGQWVKKIRGQVHYFGKLDDKDTALKHWLHEKDYLLAGEDPPGEATGMTVGELCDAFAADTEARRQGQQLSPGRGSALQYVANFIRKHMTAHRPVKMLSPGHFAALRQTIAATGWRLSSQYVLIRDIRQVFRWGEAMDLHGPVKFGPRFRLPSADELAREREADGKNRFLDRQDVLAMLNIAKPSLRCAILLGVNCGFYASDTVSLTFDRLHLSHDVPHHDLARVKNGRRRMAAIWPETAEALNDYIQNHRPKSSHRQVFLSHFNRPYATSPATILRAPFITCAKQAGVTLPEGVAIGSLRHTYGTVCDLCPDQQMIDLSMGHAPKGMQKRIYSQFNIGELDRLATLAEIVRRWLFHGEINGVERR